MSAPPTQQAKRLTTIFYSLLTTLSLNKRKCIHICAPRATCLRQFCFTDALKLLLICVRTASKSIRHLRLCVFVSASNYHSPIWVFLVMSSSRYRRTRYACTYLAKTINLSLSLSPFWVLHGTSRERFCDTMLEACLSFRLRHISFKITIPWV